MCRTCHDRDINAVSISGHAIQLLREFEGESIAQAHGQYLADHPNVFITLEGHADERGTSEYNLALAEDRAIIVSQIMGVYGVVLDRIQLVSYGEERPVALSSDEVAYSLNRRVEIVYQ